MTFLETGIFVAKVLFPMIFMMWAFVELARNIIDSDGIKKIGFIILGVLLLWFCVTLIISFT